MIQDSLTLYKLIVLYMLSRVDFPLTKAQISDFVLNQGYTNYLNLQTVFSELCEANMLTEKTVRNRTQLFLTEEGTSTLHFFEGRLSHEIKEDIDAYLKSQSLSLREEVSVTGDYLKSPDGGYQVHLVAMERRTPLVDLTLQVPTELMAEDICQNWEVKNQEIYQYLISQLFS